MILKDKSRNPKQQSENPRMINNNSYVKKQAVSSQYTKPDVPEAKKPYSFAQEAADLNFDSQVKHLLRC